MAGIHPLPSSEIPDCSKPSEKRPAPPLMSIGVLPNIPAGAAHSAPVWTNSPAWVTGL